MRGANSGSIVMTERRTLLTLAAVGAATLLGPALPTSSAAEPATNAVCGAQHSALLERYADTFNQHDADAFAEVVAGNYIQNNGRSGPGLTALQGLMRGYFATFPDFRMTIEDRIFAADKVVARSTLTATHSNPVQLGPGAPVFPPTGKKLAWGAIDIWRVADGKFVEHWDENDFVGLARQLQGK